MRILRKKTFFTKNYAYLIIRAIQISAAKVARWDKTAARILNSEQGDGESPDEMCGKLSPDLYFCRKATSKQKRIAYVTAQQRYDEFYRNFGWYRERYASFAPIEWAGRFLI